METTINKNKNPKKRSTGRGLTNVNHDAMTNKNNVAKVVESRKDKQDHIATSAHPPPDNTETDKPLEVTNIQPAVLEKGMIVINSIPCYINKKKIKHIIYLECSRQ